ncbi:hypothetical protein [Paracoccus aminovorans]|uniref:hypothetical protein n=1 Tax=Paracoccus aminovorans TaxID=34004 RepID=UPI001C12B4AB|nr:hypothetical protein [Paracoccus aminovorans]MDQ7777689.1 hypothetical protein [Paracoccus aminovorans]
MKPPATATEAPKPVSIGKLWTDYIKARQVVGSMKDGGKRGKPVIESLRVHLGHDDASKITKKDLLAWRDKLLETLGAKTVSSIYLSAVRSLLEWAVDDDRLSENPAATVKQPRPKRRRSRDPGYSDKEATAILKTSRSYEPPISVYGHVHERQPTINAKRWAPILCAFSGARIGEITQLRKQDVFQEGDRWIMRITPEAGTVKAGGYRDIPLHRQVIAEGFIKFVEQAKDGPLFSTAKNNDPPAKAVEAAAGQLKRLAAWLHELQLGGVDKRDSQGGLIVIQAGTCNGDQLGTRPDVGRGMGVS